jgi:hypothetical protein
MGLPDHQKRNSLLSHILCSKKKSVVRLLNNLNNDLSKDIKERLNIEETVFLNIKIQYCEDVPKLNDKFNVQSESQWDCFEVVLQVDSKVHLEA